MATNEDADRFACMLSEHLRCFIVVGYDMDNNRIRLTSHRNAMQQDALETMLRDRLKSLELPAPVHVASSSEPPEDGD